MWSGLHYLNNEIKRKSDIPKLYTGLTDVQWSDGKKSKPVGVLKTVEYQKIGEHARKVTRHTKFVDELTCAQHGLIGMCLDEAGLNPEKYIKKLQREEYDCFDDFLFDYSAMIHKRSYLGHAAYKMLIYATNETRSDYTKTVRDELRGKSRKAQHAI